VVRICEQRTIVLAGISPQSTGNNEWYTPDDILVPARKVLGGTIDLDPASTAKANKIVRATKFFTKEDDGLSRGWWGHVWLNAPYSGGLLHKFIRKLIDEFASGRVIAALALTHNFSETEWWQEAVNAASAVCFLSRRVQFYAPSGRIAKTAQGQHIFYFGEDVETFQREFEPAFGTVLLGKRMFVGKYLLSK
jgi:ParB family chromosome partitioning protein